MSDTRRKLYANQTVLTLKEMLQFALTQNVTVVFDVKVLESPMCKGHPYEDKYGQIVVDTIHQLKFPNDRVQY